MHDLSDVLPVFACARAIVNLCGICLGVNILSSLPFSWLLQSRILSTILIITLESSFSRVYFLITAFLKSINGSLILFTNCSFLASLIP